MSVAQPSSFLVRSFVIALYIGAVGGGVWLTATRPDVLPAAIAAVASWLLALEIHLDRRTAPAAQRQGGWFARTGRALRSFLGAIALPAGGLAALGLSALAIMRLGVAPAPFPPGALAVLLISAFAALFLCTYLGLAVQRRQTFSWACATEAALLRLAAILALLTAGVLFAGSSLGVNGTKIWSGLLLLLLTFWIVETALRAMARLFQPVRLWRGRAPLGAGWLLLPLLDVSAKAAWREKSEADAPMLSLPDMWFLPTLRKMLLPLACSSLLLVWLSTCVHEIPHAHSGLLAKFGRFHPQTLEPGLHFTLPYPFHEVALVQRSELRQVVLGLQADTGKPLLWDREHYVGEENQLVGHGEDLLTISVPIFYSIGDPFAFHRQTADAETIIRDLACQELLRETLHRSAFEIMTDGRDAVAERLRAAMQTALDARQSGLVIAKVCLRDIHPPVDVAQQYQDVVGALEDRASTIHSGEGYRAERVTLADAEATTIRSQSESLLAVRQAEVQAQAASFGHLLASYKANPEVFRIRQSYEAFDKSLRGVRKLVVDDRVRGSLPSVLDLRRTLNPDFNPEAMPENPTLIPTIRGRLNDFTRTIEGYLKMGKGSAPAPVTDKAHKDNLLENNISE